MFSQLAYFNKLKNYNLNDDGVLDINFMVNNWINAQKKINEESIETKFFKTHSIRGVVNGKYFTDPSVCGGFLYIARDPRDVVISKAKYMSTSLDESIDKLLNDEKITVCPNNVTEFVNTWENHVISWLSFKEVPSLIIKYEDMIKDTNKTLNEIIEFINKNSTFNIVKSNELLTNILESTNFQKLRNMEIKDGFEESSPHSMFFRKGQSEQWKKILSENQIKLIEKKLEVPMKYLGYK
tara:strand:+ start:1560 stop:2276 length:717 start_codon:yes stop_codon:yes gene_type:complete